MSFLPGLLTPKRRSFSSSPRRKVKLLPQSPGKSLMSPPPVYQHQDDLGLRAVGMPQLVPSCGAGDAGDPEDRFSDVAVIKSFVRKLNRRKVNLGDTVALHTKVIIHDKEYHIADFSNTVQQYRDAFPNTQISVVGSSMKCPGFTTVAIVYEHPLLQNNKSNKNLNDNNSISSNINDNNNNSNSTHKRQQQSVKAAPSSSLCSTSKDNNNHNNGGGEDQLSPQQPQRVVLAVNTACEPEILQCIVKDGKLIQIHWKSLLDKPNRKGVIRFVKKNYPSQQ